MKCLSCGKQADTIVEIWYDTFAICVMCMKDRVAFYKKIGLDLSMRYD